MENNKLRLMVGPIVLELLTGDDPEYVTALAAAISGQIDRMLEKDPRISVAQAMAFLTLQAYDDTKKAVDEANGMRDMLKAYLEDVNRYRDMLEEANLEIANLKKRVENQE